MNPFYTDYSEYLGRFFPGRKVQKISVNIGSGCPNRDGTIGRGGCIYCNNTSFTPAYCFSDKSVAEQIDEGKRFFGRKYPDMDYLAYFQSYTNTYRLRPEELRKIYAEALSCERIAGIIVGTRPDCLPDEVICMLSDLNKTAPVFVELGVESMHDRTLSLINRGHTADASTDAITRLASAGIHTGVHLIAGLPGENDEDVMESVKRICTLPVESIKMHHLQVLRGTSLHRMWEKGEISVRTYTVGEYLDLCVRVIETVPRSIAIERFLASAPPGLVVSPRWGLKNHEFTNLLINKLKNR